MKNYATIDEYIAGFPPNVQLLLTKMREAIHKAAPKAVEAISYGIPTFKLSGKNLVHFGGFKDHISFFPTSSGVVAFQEELAGLATSKGTIKLPLDKPLPLDLITRIVKLRVKQVQEKS